MEAPVSGNPAGTNEAGENTSNSRQEAVDMARLSVGSNSFLLTIKLAVSIITGSVSVLSEAVHTGVDLLAAVIANVSIRKSAAPPDEIHKFGHGKFENLSGTIEAVLIFAITLIIIYEAILKILYGAKVEYIWAGLVVMGISTVVNFIVSKKLMRTAKKSESLALEADAFHLSLDVYTSLGVFIGLAVIQVTGMMFLDPIIAIFVVLIA